MSWYSWMTADEDDDRGLDQLGGALAIGCQSCQSSSLYPLSVPAASSLPGTCSTPERSIPCQPGRCWVKAPPRTELWAAHRLVTK